MEYEPLTEKQLDYQLRVTNPKAPKEVYAIMGDVTAQKVLRELKHLREQQERLKVIEKQHGVLLENIQTAIKDIEKLGLVKYGRTTLNNAVQIVGSEWNQFKTLVKEAHSCLGSIIADKDVDALGVWVKLDKALKKVQKMSDKEKCEGNCPSCGGVSGMKPDNHGRIICIDCGVLLHDACEEIKAKYVDTEPFCDPWKDGEFDCPYGAQYCEWYVMISSSKMLFKPCFPQLKKDRDNLELDLKKECALHGKALEREKELQKEICKLWLMYTGWKFFEGEKAKQALAREAVKRGWPGIFDDDHQPTREPDEERTKALFEYTCRKELSYDEFKQALKDL